MGVFTTRTLLNSVGVSQSRATSGAVAINWILKVKLVVLKYLIRRVIVVIVFLVYVTFQLVFIKNRSINV